jgi:hypothetical protein
MAAYAATVSSLLRRSVKVDAVNGVYMYSGTVNVTNYNSTLVALTGISGQFRSIISVVAGVTDSGYLLEWVAASNSFKAYYFDYDAGADGAAIEVADDTDVGQAYFTAFGLA